MHNPQLIKTFDAAGAIATHRIVQLDSNGKAEQAYDRLGALLGTTELAYSVGERADVVVDGIVEVQAECEIRIGDWITAGEAGKAAPASPFDSIIGMAITTANSDEYVSVRLAPGRGDARDETINVFASGDGDIAANRIVKIGSDGKWAQASSASDALAGIALINSDPEHNFEAAIAGVAEVEAGGSITAGAFVTADSDGKAVTATYANSYVGMALAGASAGEKLPVAIHLGKLEHEEVGGSPED